MQNSDANGRKDVTISMESNEQDSILPGLQLNEASSSINMEQLKQTSNGAGAVPFPTATGNPFAPTAPIATAVPAVPTASTTLSAATVSTSPAAPIVPTTSTASAPPLAAAAPTVPAAPAAPAGNSARGVHLLRDILSLSTAPSTTTLRTLFRNANMHYNSLDNPMSQHPLSLNDRAGGRQAGANLMRMSSNNEGAVRRSISLREGEKLPLCGAPKMPSAETEPAVPNPATSSTSTTSSNSTQAATDVNQNQAENTTDNPHEQDASNLDWLRFLPLAIILFVQFVYEHWEVMLEVLMIQIVLLNLNRTLPLEVIRYENKSYVALLRDGLIGILVVAIRLYLATDLPDPIGLIVPPETGCNMRAIGSYSDTIEEEVCTAIPLGTLIYHAVVSDLILQLLTIIIKIIITLLPLSEARMKFRARLYALIEYISQFYRALAPIKEWILYFTRSYPDNDYITYTLCGLYIFYKACELLYRKKSLVKAFTTFKCKLDSKRTPSEKELKEADSFCPICNDPYKLPVILDCGHIFCDVCVHTWLRRVSSCPMCRAKVSDDPVYQDGKTSEHYQIY